MISLFSGKAAVLSAEAMQIGHFRLTIVVSVKNIKIRLDCNEIALKSPLRATL
jgi:hypothetical protein